MCQKCVDLVTKYYPSLNEEEQHVLLINATCFPFGNPEDIEKQLIELKEKTDGSLEQALVFANEELDRQVAEMKKQEEEKTSP